jgi:hypothetical protein
MRGALDYLVFVVLSLGAWCMVPHWFKQARIPLRRLPRLVFVSAVLGYLATAVVMGAHEALSPDSPFNRQRLIDLIVVGGMFTGLLGCLTALFAQADAAQPQLRERMSPLGRGILRYCDWAIGHHTHAPPGARER